LEGSLEIEPELKDKIDKSLKDLVPPKNMTEAKNLASAGNLSLPYLKKKKKIDVHKTSAIIRTLSLIDTEESSEVLKDYVSDKRITVIKELFRSVKYISDDYLLKEIYKGKTRIEIENPSLLLSLAGLDTLEDLWLRFFTAYINPDILNSFPNLKMLRISHLFGDDLDFISLIDPTIKLHIDYIFGGSDYIDNNRIIERTIESLFINIYDRYSNFHEPLNIKFFNKFKYINNLNINSATLDNSFRELTTKVEKLSLGSRIVLNQTLEDFFLNLPPNIQTLSIPFSVLYNLERDFIQDFLTKTSINIIPREISLISNWNKDIDLFKELLNRKYSRRKNSLASSRFTRLTWSYIT